MYFKQLLAFLALCFFSIQCTAKGIGYETIADALEQIKSKENVKVSNQGGWTIIEDQEDGNMVLWSFTPSSHAAAPAAVKRKVVELDGKIFIQMSALCQAEKEECDKLMFEFEKLNEKIKGSF